jgi:hypothetical protein
MSDIEELKAELRATEAAGRAAWDEAVAARKAARHLSLRKQWEDWDAASIKVEELRAKIANLEEKS